MQRSAHKEASMRTFGTTCVLPCDLRLPGYPVADRIESNQEPDT